jgi:hypothetical protein
MHPAALRRQELCMGSGKEQENQCCNDKQNGRASASWRKMPKVAKYSIGTDEAVVAKIPERAGVTILRAKGFT